MLLNYRAGLAISTSPYMGLENKVIAHDCIVSINRGRAKNVNIRKNAAGLVLCRIARESILEQLGGKPPDLSQAITVDAASTQINLVAGGAGAGAISRLMLGTIPNDLKTGRLVPEIKMEISLMAHSFSALSPAEKAFADIIMSLAKDIA